MGRITPSFWRTRGVKSWLLRPFSWLYRLGAVVRQHHRSPVYVNPTVWCVGNLVAGGAGKTPTALALGRWAKSQGLRACFLTRGYGGSLPGPCMVDPAVHTAHHVGDEPLLLATCLPTFISRNRAEGALHVDEEGFELIIMDDGFQNPTVHKDFALVVVDAAYGFGNGLCLPAGPLREPVHAGLRRADAVVVLSRGGEDATLNLPNHLPVHRGLLQPHYSQPIAGEKLVAFCGIAQPDAFFAGLEAAGATLCASHVFADHHPFTAAQWTRLKADANAHQARLITTAKDAVRLSEAQKADVVIADLHLVWQKEVELDRLLQMKLGEVDT